MITKETDYIREILKSVKENTREKQLLLANLKGNIPERIYETDPLTKLFRYFIDSSSDEEEPESHDGLEDELEDESVKPLTEEQVSDIDALIEDVQNEKDDSELKIEDKKSGNIGADTVKDKKDQGDQEDQEDKEEKELIDMAKQDGGDNYELSFF